MGTFSLRHFSQGRSRVTAASDRHRRLAGLDPPGAETVYMCPFLFDPLDQAVRL